MQTQPNPDDGTRRVLVVVDREFPGDQHGDARRVAEAVDGSDVLVVAPAGPVPGERWIVDLTARDAQARRRLAGWTDALAAHARFVEGEVGDPNPRQAVADARAEFGPDRVIGTLGCECGAWPAIAAAALRSPRNYATLPGT